jgi:hypothetical protein
VGFGLLLLFFDWPLFEPVFGGRVMSGMEDSYFFLANGLTPFWGFPLFDFLPYSAFRPSEVAGNAGAFFFAAMLFIPYAFLVIFVYASFRTSGFGLRSACICRGTILCKATIRLATFLWCATHGIIPYCQWHVRG